MEDLVFDLASAEFGESLHERVDDRRRAGAFWARTPTGRVFFNQEDAAWIMRCTDFRFSFVSIDSTTSPYLATAIEHELLNMHGEPHARLRRLISAALRDRVADDLKAQIADVADGLIDAMPSSGVVDLRAEFTEILPGRVLGPMYGVPYEDTPELDEWINIGGRKLDALQSGVDIDIVEDANRKLHDYLRTLLHDRRRNLGTDMFSELIRAEVDGDRFSEDELVYLAGELASAGVDTTREQLPLTLLALLDHPEELARLVADPSLAMGAVDEGMRFAPLPWAIPHAAVHDVEYRGIQFQEGDLVSVLIPALNRDPAVVADPHTFDIGRRARNFSFGHGAHACPAAQLARIEMAIALEHLVRRVDIKRLVERPPIEPVGQGRTPPHLRVEIRKR